MEFITKIIFSLLFFVFFFTEAQELPPIKNYDPIHYRGGNQNWSISQSDEKYIYIANNSGLLEFDGAKWKLYTSPNNTIIRSVNVIGKRIYTGCYMEFGYWEKDEFSNLKYYSLVNKLNAPLIEDEHFWNIINFDNWILFQSLNRIYIYNTIDESFNIINSETTRAEIFKVGNSIYFQKINEGIFKIENGKSILVSNHPIFQKNALVGAFSIDKKTLFLTEQGKFYFLKKEGLAKWNVLADDELSSVNVYSSLQLNDGSFILGTISNGIYHVDKDGNILREINQEKGLNNNTVLSIFEDFEHNLWLGLDNGISIVNLYSPFSIYNDQNGKLGTVYTSKIFNNYLYLGTNQGLFYKKLNTQNDFKFIENTKGQVWCLKEFDNTLFCGHNTGTYIIDHNVAKQIADFPGTWDIKTIENSKNLLLQGNYTGLSILEKINNQWQFRNKIEGFDISSRFFEFINEHKIIINHEQKGIFKLSIDPLFKRIADQENEAPNGYGSSLTNYNNHILYTSNEGVFKFNLNQQKFEKDSLLTSTFFSKDNVILGIPIADNTNKIWGFTDKNIICLSPGKFNNTPQAIKIPIPASFRKSLGVTGFECLTHLEDELYLIGTSNGYTILNLDMLKPREYAVKINSIYKGLLNTSEKQVSLINSTKFKSTENNLYITFSVPEFDKYTEVSYQYKLEGIYNDWSSWFSNPYVSLKNLPYGNYTFKVRAFVGYDLSNNIASYSFSIEKPWYISNLFLFIYILLFIGILFVIHLIYKRYYTKQKQKLIKKKHREFELAQLESHQKLMLIKNKQLNQEIESKNRELTISTMSIIKKNEILNKIKKELMVKNADEVNKQVIKTIDKNINNKKDWEFLEEAFNNADKDFLKKVKRLHPQLTPNDLRFCAYLRLNLSSKEIAPLLNISVRSVEIKRYRLRKKMNLPHEKSLVDYILAI